MNNKTLPTIFLCLVLFPLISAGGFLYVNISSDYTTIQSAINNANEGDTIVVDDGTYNENIVINKSITLLGKQNAVDARTRSSSEESVIKSFFSEGAIQVQADDVVIDGFKITDSFKGIHATEECSGLIIKNNIFLGPIQEAINLQRASTALVEYNFIEGANTSAITGGDDKGTSSTGDDLITKARIMNNLIEDSKSGITGYQKDSVIEGNVIGNFSASEGTGIGGQFLDTKIKNNLINGYSSGKGFVLESHENRPFSENINFFNNILTNNYMGIYSNQTLLGKFINISFNSLSENIIGAANVNTASVLNVKYNYWGACDGPSGTGPGSGDQLSGNLTYIPWIGACIDAKAHEPECILKNEEITLYANISSGLCIGEVIFSLNSNSVWQNFTGHYTDSILGNYMHVLDTHIINNSFIYWTVYAEDCYNHTIRNGIEKLYIYPPTTLIITPSSPNGENGWYTTNPIFTLINPNASQIYYQWDSQETLMYSSLFGFEDAPNNQNITGGIIDLNYWSQYSSCNKNESFQSKAIKVDLTPPEINDLSPENNTIVYDLTPEISASIKDKINADSGINISSLVFKLDNEIKTGVITINKSDFNYDIKYTPDSALSLGVHNVEIYVRDYAGRSSEIKWGFEIKELPSSELKVYLPEKGIYIYGNKKIQLNITTSERVKLIELIDWNERNRWTRLCSNCEEYGFFFKRIKTFKDGGHNLTIRSTNFQDISTEENFLFSIDSKFPIVYKTYPRTNSFTDGSDFYVKILEENVERIIIIINNTHEYNVTECQANGKYTECYADINLSEFEGKEIEYFFRVYDVLRSSDSRTSKIKVDSIAPKVNIISPEPNKSYKRRVLFEIEVNESNFDSLSYSYEYGGRIKNLRLCSSLKEGLCKILKGFSPGNYSLTITATDKAGNSIGLPVEFEVL